MALIEIRDAEGTRLAAADDLSDAIQQLVDLATRYRKIIRRYQERLDEAADLPPDLSGTAPEHAAVYGAGWKAGRDAAVSATLSR